MCTSVFLLVIGGVCHVIAQSWEQMYRNNFIRYYHSEQTLKSIDNLVEEIKTSIVLYST